MLLLVIFSLCWIDDVSGYLNPEDLLKYIDKIEEGNYFCTICASFSHKNRANVRNHVESKHFTNTFLYTCPHCGKECPSHQALLKHKSRNCPIAKQLKEKWKQTFLMLQETKHQRTFCNTLTEWKRATICVSYVPSLPTRRGPMWGTTSSPNTSKYVISVAAAVGLISRCWNTSLCSTKICQHFKDRINLWSFLALHLPPFQVRVWTWEPILPNFMSLLVMILKEENTFAWSVQSSPTSLEAMWGTTLKLFTS